MREVHIVKRGDRLECDDPQASVKCAHEGEYEGALQRLLEKIAKKEGGRKTFRVHSDPHHYNPPTFHHLEITGDIGCMFKLVEEQTEAA